MPSHVLNRLTLSLVPSEPELADPLPLASFDHSFVSFFTVGISCTTACTAAFFDVARPKPHCSLKKTCVELVLS